MIKKLLPCIGEYKKYVFLAPLAIIGEVLLEVFIPLIMSLIIDKGIPNQDIPYIFKMGLLMILMAAISMFFGAIAAKFTATAGAGFAKGVRRKLFYKIQDLSFSNIDKFSTASLITRMTTDVNNTQNALMMVIRTLVRAPFMLVCAVFMAFSINKKLALIFLIALPVLGTSLFVISSTAFPRFQKMFKKYDRLNSVLQESLIAIRVVKAFVRGDYENEKFDFAAEDVKKTQLSAEKIVILNSPIMQFTMYACMIAISWFGGNMIIAGNMLTGQLMSFISYVSQILMSLMMLSMIFVMLVISRASVSRITEVLDELPDITDENASSDLRVSDGSIEFKNVFFKYNKDADDFILQNINIKISAGETVGIIGGTGSAKTTLVQLIPRLYDVYEGSVLVGGKDVRDYKLTALRDAVSVVLQKNTLFSGTIKENLLWGNENASDGEITAACKLACAHDFVTSFPDGYETNLGQGGVNLSGGQKQRLCIARALLKSPKIIILDDSTSAVDTATDASIREALKNTRKNMTSIIVAQRITSVCDADKIIVMDDGKIDAIGTHEELLATNTIYKEVYESQQKGVCDNE